MTASILVFDEARKEFGFQEIVLDSTFSSVGPSHLSGRELAKRLSGLLSQEKADELDRNIEASCEQIDD